MQKGIVTADLVIQELLREVMAQLHQDPEAMEELFDLYITTNLAIGYGQKQIDELKTYLKDTKLNVIDGYSQLDAKMPAYVVLLGSAQELNNEALLDDFGAERFIDEDGEDIPTGKSRLDTEPLTAAGGKIEQIASSIQENVIVDCLAHDKPLVARYMAWILHYVMRANKNVLIERGINTFSLAFSDFHPWEQAATLPDLIYRRLCTITCQHWLHINTDVSDRIVNSLTVQLKAQDKGTTEQGDIEEDIILTIED